MPLIQRTRNTNRCPCEGSIDSSGKTTGHSEGLTAVGSINPQDRKAAVNRIAPANMIMRLMDGGLRVKRLAGHGRLGTAFISRPSISRFREEKDGKDV